MISGAADISRGWPAVHVLKVANDQKLNAKSPSEIAGDDVVLSAVEHPPRIGETRPIAALLPDVLARYGLTATVSPPADAAAAAYFAQARGETSIDVSV
jgi:hypothetical protein